MTTRKDLLDAVDYAEAFLKLNATDAESARRQIMANAKRLDFPCGCSYSTIVCKLGDGSRSEAPVVYYCNAHRTLKPAFLRARDAEAAPNALGKVLARTVIGVRRAIAQATMALAGRVA